jgi:hypothetical protein
MVKFLVLLAIVAGLGYWYWTTTPEFAVQQVRNAVREHDLKKFKQYADTESVASNLVDDLLTKPMQQALGPGVFGQVIVGGIVGMFKPVFVKGVEKQLIHFVETGELRDQTADGSADDDVQGISLGKLDGRFGFRKHAFRSIEYDKRDGKVATVGVKLHNEVYNKDLVLDLKLHDEGGYWQVVELSNFPEFVGKIMEYEAGSLTDSGSASDQTKEQQGI